MKRNKGITLIALVITIVVLIILAGVAISLSIGENGIFNKAKYASEMYSNEQENEKIEIGKYPNSIDEYVDGGRGAYEDGYKKGQESAKIVRQVITSFKYSGHDVAEDWASSENPYYGYGTKQIDVTQIPNYDKLTKDNFCIELNNIEVAFGSSISNINNAGVTATIVSYENGILTINIPRHVRNSYHGTAHLGISIVAYYIDYE